MRDIGQALRLIRRQRVFSGFAILILAGGIGAATNSRRDPRGEDRRDPVELLRG